MERKTTKTNEKKKCVIRLRKKRGQAESEKKQKKTKKKSVVLSTHRPLCCVKVVCSAFCWEAFWTTQTFSKKRGFSLLWSHTKGSFNKNTLNRRRHFYTHLWVYSSWLSLNVLKSSLRRPRSRSSGPSVPESTTTWTRTSPRLIASSKLRKFSHRHFISSFVFYSTHRVFESVSRSVWTPKRGDRRSEWTTRRKCSSSFVFVLLCVDRVVFYAIGASISSPTPRSTFPRKGQNAARKKMRPAFFAPKVATFSRKNAFTKTREKVEIKLSLTGVFFCFFSHDLIFFWLTSFSLSSF